MKVRPFFYLIGITLLAVCCNPFLAEPLKLSGTLEMTEHSVGARVAGRISALYVEEGDKVGKGELIATLDRFDQARRDYLRLLRLHQRGGISKQAVEKAELDYKDQRIVSPVSGVVMVKIHELGEVAAAGGAVATIGDRDDMWVRVFVPEGKINRVEVNQPAAVRFDGIQKTFKGHVSFIAPKAEFTPRNVQTPEERVTQTFAVKIRLDHPETYLRSGVAADVVIKIRRG